MKEGRRKRRKKSWILNAEDNLLTGKSPRKANKTELLPRPRPPVTVFLKVAGRECAKVLLENLN